MLIYSEKQKFGAWYMSLLFFVMAGLCLYTMYRIWGQEMNWVHFLAPVIALISIVAMASVSLVTRIETDAIQVGFPLLGKRTIPRSEIARAYVRQYSPIGEYGGWGYRIGRNGKAYNTMGDQGLQLELQDGSRILIGTQRPAELRKVIAGWIPNAQPTR